MNPNFNEFEEIKQEIVNIDEADYFLRNLEHIKEGEDFF
jgi:hypothetical protein